VDRNLDTIFRSERSSPDTKRAFLKQIATAISHLHANGFVHGDIKLLNAVRYQGSLRLMDLDASVKISSKQNKTYIGAKSSSGVLPPEMIASIKNNEDFKKFNTYFEEMKGIDIDPEQWKKVQAKKNKR